MPSIWGGPVGTAHIRGAPEDFFVREILGFQPEGDGEHVWLWIRKRGVNTHFLASRLARWAGVSAKDVSFAGQKDRHAVTEQWFSVYLPGRRTPPLSGLASDAECDFTVLLVTRGRRKLARGAHRGNWFRLQLTELEVRSRSALDARLRRMSACGVPNAFGPQRFGHEAGNLETAQRWFATGRRPRQTQQRSMALSAARSWLFNRYLAARMRNNSWHRCVAGEWAAGGGGLIPEPTGPLFGRGQTHASDVALELETEIADTHRPWVDALAKAGLKLTRRRLKSRPTDLQWSVESRSNALELSFYLPRGEYATTVLAALVEARDASGIGTISGRDV
ncbi:MAG: tRNA pseudouridine(13) synthase TruD [Pseudomonadota bacterium]